MGGGGGSGGRGGGGGYVAMSWVRCVASVCESLDRKIGAWCTAYLGSAEHSRVCWRQWGKATKGLRLLRKSSSPNRGKRPLRSAC